MSKPRELNRRRPGERLAAHHFETLAHGTVSVPAATNIHLQFRRFAGCPVCNLHLRTFARAAADLAAADVQTIAFFHSSADSMRPYQGDLPFPVVPDPDRRWYAEFGVERAMFAIAHPWVMWAAVKGLVLAPSNPFAGGSVQTGLPADFLIDRTGTIVAVHYGAHANDQWRVDQVIALLSPSARSAER
jgi:peroxiredoxin